MKIVEFVLIIGGKWSELEPEPEFFDKLEPELEPHKNGPAPQRLIFPLNTSYNNKKIKNPCKKVQLI
jgi:hypothetical protein